MSVTEITKKHTLRKGETGSLPTARKSYLHYLHYRYLTSNEALN